MQNKKVWLYRNKACSGTAFFKENPAQSGLFALRMENL